jgi:hypothetical protein
VIPFFSKELPLKKLEIQEKIISHTLAQKKDNLFFIEKQRLFFLNFNQVNAC